MNKWMVSLLTVSLTGFAQGATDITLPGLPAQILAFVARESSQQVNADHYDISGRIRCSRSQEYRIAYEPTPPINVRISCRVKSEQGDWTQIGSLTITPRGQQPSQVSGDEIVADAIAKFMQYGGNYSFSGSFHVTKDDGPVKATVKVESDSEMRSHAARSGESHASSTSNGAWIWPQNGDGSARTGNEPEGNWQHAWTWPETH